MNNRARIIDYLQGHPEGADDDTLSEVLGLKYRQQANSICRGLQRIGKIQRRIKNGKLNNFWIDYQNKIENKVIDNERLPNNGVNEPTQKQWFWEGNIQQRVVDYLQINGYMIESFADTANRQRGVDIKAKSDDGEIWITVKGYPIGTKNTPPSTQASHWFKQAIFDIIDYRNQNVLNIGIALPDFPRYHSLLEKTIWLKNVTSFKVFWVDQNGNVIIE